MLTTVEDVTTLTHLLERALSEATESEEAWRVMARKIVVSMVPPSEQERVLSNLGL